MSVSSLSRSFDIIWIQNDLYESNAIIRKRVDSFDSQRSFCIQIMSQDLLSEDTDTS